MNEQADHRSPVPEGYHLDPDPLARLGLPTPDDHQYGPHSSGVDAPDERIRCRAYDIYLERGGEDGHALDDWLQAEKQLTE